MIDLDNFKKRLQVLKEGLNLPGKQAEIRRLEAETMTPDFWADQKKASREMKKLAHLQEEISEIFKLEELIKANQLDQIEERLKRLELKLFFSGPYDSLPALLSIHAGQGGVEAMDWALMLQRMYLKYFDRKKWTWRLLDESPGEEAGIKSVLILVDEPFAYGYLHFEAGTHRLVRQSPFNADQKRQTSFALVEVLPQMKKGEVEIKDDDLEWQFFRSSTQGGQNVQKVSTAVRLRHKPSDLVVTCQTQRYQEQNRKIALELLSAKLWQRQEFLKHREMERLKKGRTMAAWGTQIRSYVLHPYKQVKDVRTDVETSNAEAVLDGDLEIFIEAEIHRLSKSN
ncbi:MAG: PCRF domain-containing protein [Candidatus Pacebacteria bacterium]|nr:PCRF domain-containing protein [Candidatus Paceibacterota bacterium]